MNCEEIPRRLRELAKLHTADGVLRAQSAPETLRRAADFIETMLMRKGDLARAGCPDCDPEIPLPVMRCMRCGQAWYLPED